jgi:prepilin-type N-terminal cleavage/methylation domain-containing protein
MNAHQRRKAGTGCRQSGFTLAEVLISIIIAGVAVSGIWTGYLLVAQRAEWSTASSAAQTQALRRMEQVRAARWDPFDPSYPSTNADQLVASNFPDLPEPLDVLQTSGNPLMGTTQVAITDLSTNAPYLRMIQVDCVWSLPTRGPFTNTVITYRTADQ